jgi:hypothetical protein
MLFQRFDVYFKSSTKPQVRVMSAAISWAVCMALATDSTIYHRITSDKESGSKPNTTAEKYVVLGYWIHVLD